MSVYVCPENYIVCGDRPENWCEGCMCPKALQLRDAAQPSQGVGEPVAWQCRNKNKGSSAEWVEIPRHQYDAIVQGYAYGAKLGWWEARQLYAAPTPPLAAVPAPGLREAAQNAERYLWLRAGELKRQGVTVAGRRDIDRSSKQALMTFNYWCSPEELDAAIDSARADLAAAPGDIS